MFDGTQSEKNALSALRALVDEPVGGPSVAPDRLCPVIRGVPLDTPPEEGGYSG